MEQRLSKFFSYIAQLLIVFCAVSAHGQQSTTQSTTQSIPVNAELTSPQLQSLVASIALYPDALLAQMLMASTYPLEVATAANWLRQNRLSGDALDAVLSEQQWDNSVKSLVHFPDVLNLLGNHLEWTRRLGDAYLAQPAEVMSAIQTLRMQARLNGQLNTGAQVQVSTDAQSNIVIIPANPEIVYVPVYNPWVVYASWPYAAYPPYPVFNPAWGVVAFGVGYGIGYSLWAYPYWGRGGLYINHAYYNRFNTRYNIAAYRHPVRAGSHSPWAFNASHRQNVPYASPAVHQRYAATAAPQQYLTQSRQAAQNTFHQAMPVQQVSSATRAVYAPRAVSAPQVTSAPRAASVTQATPAPHTHQPQANGHYSHNSGSQRANHSGRSDHR